MTNIPEVDLPIEEQIVGKLVVIYTANSRGEFPHSFTKSFIPSSIPLANDWFVGYAPYIIDGFNMVEIPDIIAKGLQSYNIINGSFKRYDQYNRANENNEKLEIIMSSEDIKNQLVSKKFLINYELRRVYDMKIKKLYVEYGNEVDTWNIQLEEAKAFTANNNTPTPFIANLATIRGIELSTLVTTILTKAEAFSIAMSTLIGTKQKFSDNVKVSTTDLELINIINEIGNV